MKLKHHADRLRNRRHRPWAELLEERQLLTGDAVLSTLPVLAAHGNNGLLEFQGTDFTLGRTVKDDQLAIIETSQPSGAAEGTTVSIDWGDQTTPTAGEIVTFQTPDQPIRDITYAPLPTSSFNSYVYGVAGEHSYQVSGSYTISVKITTADGQATTVTDRASVAPGSFTLMPPSSPMTTVVGTSLTNTFLSTLVSEAPVGDLDSYHVSIDWGDGTAATEGKLDEIFYNDAIPSHPEAAVVGSHVYDKVGTYTVGVTVTNANGETATLHFEMQVFRDSVSILGPSEAQTATVAHSLVDLPLSRFVDSNPNATPADFDVTIDWGDGTTTPGIVTAAQNSSDPSGGTQFVVTGDHMYLATGDFLATITISGATFATQTDIHFISVNIPAPIWPPSSPPSPPSSPVLIGPPPSDPVPLTPPLPSSINPPPSPQTITAGGAGALDRFVARFQAVVARHTAKFVQQLASLVSRRQGTLPVVRHQVVPHVSVTHLRTHPAVLRTHPTFRHPFRRS